MQVELRAVADICPYEGNPRKNDDAVDAVARSIQEYGFRQPVVIDTDGVIVVGHTRWKAAKQLGLEKIPVHVARDLTPEKAKAYRLADNRTNESAEWDYELLPVELASLRELGIDLDAIGFTNEELEELLAPPPTEGLTDPDEVPEPPDDPTSKPGDLYLLGEHRLLCGDSTSVDDVRRLMNGERAVLFATDPPYLVNYDGTNHPHKWNEERNKNKDWSETYGVTWDDADANPELYDRFIAVAVAEAIEPDAAWYCWHASRRQALLESVWEKHGAFVHQQLIWNKNRPILTRSWYMWRHEPCFFGWVRGRKPQRSVDEYLATVWDIPTHPPGQSPEHPTSKPVELFAIPMRQHTRRGQICYEPFAGSGTQIIAAEQLGRRCDAMEISPAYCDVCVERWEQFTGMKAQRIAADGVAEKKASTSAEAGKQGSS